MTKKDLVIKAFSKAGRLKRGFCISCRGENLPIYSLQTSKILIMRCKACNVKEIIELYFTSDLKILQQALKYHSSL